MTRRRKTTRPEYTNEFDGIYGIMGEENTAVKYVQTAIDIDDLDRLTLVEDISGSEEWSVRDLFQRDVDRDRVLEKEVGIVDYLKNQMKQKFFNPLTIALLPIENSQIMTSIGEKESTGKDDGNDIIHIYESKGFYKIERWEDNFAKIHWHNKKVKLVALDGQHRLYALKTLKMTLDDDSNDPDLRLVNFSEWRIPLVLLILPTQKKAGFDILGRARDIFVTINKTARPPSRAQRIILDDYSITSICCQEYLEYCHKEKTSKVPLLLFDWKATSNKDAVDCRACLLRVEELENFHMHYLVGFDQEETQTLSDKQDTRFKTSDMDPGLNYKKLNWRESIRKRYRELWIPVLECFFSEFLPTKNYLTAMKKIEDSCTTDIKKKALKRLKFGITGGKEPSGMRAAIDKEVDNIILDHMKEQGKMRLFNKLIGLRGILSGFNLILNDQVYSTVFKDTKDFLKPMKWYLKHMNKAFRNNLFDDDPSTNKLLRHLVFDHNDNISSSSYRLENQKNRLGAFCALIACAYECNNKKHPKLLSQIDDYLSDLSNTLFGGYKRQVRTEISGEKAKLTIDAFNKKVERKANTYRKNHINLIIEKLSIPKQ